MGRKLDASRYKNISSTTSRNDTTVADGQVRIYVQLGRRDGYYPREIAEFFSNLLQIPQRMVDRIDCATNFALVNLPQEAAKKALELSKRDPKIPHMHVDTNTASGRRGGSAKRSSRRADNRNRSHRARGGSNRSNSRREKTGATETRGDMEKGRYNAKRPHSTSNARNFIKK